nr:winged helix-turn-helix domain-containing protein [uncultured Carboxylicivirga sp.]
MKITEKEKNSFYQLVDSLKKSRRADLSDINNDSSIIEELYVDPLDSDFVLRSCLQPNTTMLIGRKGTGKSTIIARLQHEYRKSKDRLSLYIDVKSIFEQSKNFSYDSSPYRNLITSQDLENYLIYKTFLKQIIEQIKSEVKTNTLRFFLSNISQIFGPDKRTYDLELEDIFNEIEKNEYVDIQILKEKNINDEEGTKVGYTEQTKDSGKLGISEKGASIGLSSEQTDSFSSGMNTKKEEQYSEILLKCFNPSVILKSIKSLLAKLGIKYVVICLDDFSEIEERAMRVFVDTIVSPLNNWSDEFFKFKIAAYPGRIYLGDIDPQKIEQIKLDYYDLYNSRRVTNIQSEAQKSVKKLLTKRINYFCKNGPDYFFDTSKNDLDDYYALLFNITSSVPRNIGWILWYAYQNSISKDQKITLRDLQLGSEKYFESSIYPYFSQNKFMREPFNLKLEKYHLKQLLESLIASAKQNKREIPKLDSKIFQADKNKPLTSHFYLDHAFEDLISSLELHFFITKFNEQKDQDSNTIMSFFSLNYGLCMKEDINYGRGSDRKYVIQRRFNYTENIKKYISNAKQIRCQNEECKEIFSFEKLESLQLFDMLCPKCRKGTCEVEHVTGDYKDTSKEIQIPEFDLNFLNSLKIEQPQYPSSLAQELDCTYQKISKRAIKLKDSGLITSEKLTIDKSIGERTYYKLTDKSLELYYEK